MLEDLAVGLLECFFRLNLMLAAAVCLRVGWTKLNRKWCPCNPNAISSSVPSMFKFALDLISFLYLLQVVAMPLLIDDFSLPLNRLECDLSDEFAARQRELDWIATVGDDLAKRVDPEEECDARAMASEVEERWQKVVFGFSDHFIRSFLKILVGSVPLTHTHSLII